MADRDWQSELDQFLQQKLSPVGQPNESAARPYLRVLPAAAGDEAKYFMLGIESGLFDITINGEIESRLVATSVGPESFRIFAPGPSPPRLARERVCQLATAAALVFDRGWLERQVELIPSAAADGVGILVRTLSGKLVAGVVIKRAALELTKLGGDLIQCSRRGPHPIDNCGFPQNHRHFEFCASQKPPYLWAVAPGADICFHLIYPAPDNIQVEELPSLPRRSRIELEQESFWGKKDG